MLKRYSLTNKKSTWEFYASGVKELRYVSRETYKEGWQHEASSLCGDVFLFGEEDMRRKDREVKEFPDIVRIIEDCSILVLGLNAHERPYLVPLNYTSEIINQNIIIYFHCALEGYKLDLIRENNNCSFVIYQDLGIRINEDGQSATNCYASVMGNGKVEIIEDKNEKMRIALKLLGKYKLDFLGGSLSDKDVEGTHLARIAVEQITGKANRRD